MKNMTAFALALCLVLSLAACGQKDSGKQDSENPDVMTEQTEQPADGSDGNQEKEIPLEQTISGVVNQLDDYLVLLDEEDEYRIFDYGIDVDPTELEEGDRVIVTYNGILGDEENVPVAVAIDKADD